MLFSAGMGHEGEGSNSPERGRKRTSNLDFAKMCWRGTITAFTVLGYFQGYARISLCGGGTEATSSVC